MCGILGIISPSISPEQITEAKSLLNARGRNGTHTVQLKSSKTKHPLGIFIHSLHAIVNNIPQPITHKGTLITNCEIYNWQTLKKKYKFRSRNDADFLCQFLDKHNTELSPKRLSELDGVYAFAYHHQENIILARDILGEKPLWYSQNQHPSTFAFASEKKMLLKLGFPYPQELNPRHILNYNINSKKITLLKRPFFKIQKPLQTSYQKIKETTKNLLDAAIQKRIPNKQFGILFSGGVDSTYFAHYLKEQGYKFTCYVTSIETPNSPIKSIDLLQATAAAKEIGVPLKIISLTISEYETLLKTVVPLIEDTNVVKASVAVTLYAACKQAASDGCKVIFSGSGAEEIFAGYDRHKHSTDINDECISGLRKLYERDLYRDDVLTINSGVELRLPYLDIPLTTYALKIPEKYKIKNNIGKYLLRDIAQQSGLSQTVSWAKKVAAQYGSKSDYALEKLAKSHHYPSKSSYLKSIYSPPNLRLGVLFSGGKDSTYAAYNLQRQNYELTCLITIKTKNSESYMFQSSGIEVTPLQAVSMGIPLITQESSGIKEKELQDLKKALRNAKTKYHIEGIVSGAVASTYQRNRIEKICDELGLKVFAPLWHKDPEQEMKELLSQGFNFLLIQIAADGLNSSILGKTFTLSDLQKLIILNKKNRLHVNGEGGEFESIVIDCPLFTQKLIIDKMTLQQESACVAKLIIQKAHLEKK